MVADSARVNHDLLKKDYSSPKFLDANLLDYCAWFGLEINVSTKKYSSVCHGFIGILKDLIHAKGGQLEE